jgi:insulysin
MNKVIVSLLVTMGFLLLAGCAHQQSRPSSDVSIIQSPNDERQYEYLVLPNELRVVLISDAEADKGAASLTVGVGSTANPADREGLAHFLEHMLFMGTRKYPGVDEYGAFIKRHGGSTNAYTADNETTYLFDIKQQQLEPALDRFSQFFVAPLFAAEYVDREKNAVNSEYQLKLKDESRRVFAAQQQIMNPRSPYAKFKVGSLDTLADRENSKVRDDLLEFYNTHYSANLMTLAVVGRQPLPVLRKWVEEKFSAVPNHHTKRLVPESTQYLAGELPSRLQVLPLKDTRSVSYTFPIPPLLEQYKTKPVRYLAHFIGDEGKGSLLSLLKQKGWATRLSAGAGSLDATEAEVFVSIDLTSAGINHVDEITGYLFGYVQLLSDQGIVNWRYAEQKKQADLGFQFKEKGSSLWYVVGVSSALQDYPAQDVLRAGSMKEVFDAGLIKGFLSYIKPENMAMTVVSPDVQGDRVESNYQVHYKVDQIPAGLISDWSSSLVNSALALPESNQFLPDRVALKPIPQVQPVPQMLTGTQNLELWHQQEDVFGVPRASFMFMLKSDVANDTPTHGVLRALLEEILKEQLNEFAYPASIAGLNYEIDGNSEGFMISISGYDQKQGVLLRRIAQAMKNPDYDNEKFLIYKEELQRKLENAALDKPFTQLLGERSRVMTSPSWSPEERLAVLGSISLDDVKAYADDFFRQLEVEALSYGNVTTAEAGDLGRILEQQILSANSSTKVADRKYRTLSSGDPLDREYYVDHPDSVVIYQYQGEDKSVLEHARWRLLGQMMSNEFFSSLRTEQQLGYVVFSSFVEDEQMPGLVMLVQSSAVSANEVQKRMGQFTKDFVLHLAEMDEQKFTSHKQGLIAELLKKDEMYLSRAKRYWGDMERDNYTFDYRQQLADKIAELEQSELQAFYQRQMLEHPRALVVSDTGNKFGG